MRGLVFVYGSLKQGHYNNSVFPEGSELWGEASTPPEYTLLDLGSFPGVVHEGDTEVNGEVWSVPDFDNLDRLEGNGSFYTREEHEVVGWDGTKIPVWIYLLPPSYISDNIIEEGEWV